MFQNISQTYSSSDASIEIIIMLIGAFIIGWVLGKLMTAKAPLVLLDQGEDEEEISEEIQEAALSLEDNLKLIEGVGPAIEKLLYKYGVRTYSDMVEEGAEGLEEILINGGKKYSMHDPATWPDQAKLADSGKWSELEEYQEILKGGRK